MDSQRNDVLSLVLRHGGFAVSDFEWQGIATAQDEIISVLAYRPGDPRQFHFAFNWDELEAVAEYSPAEEHRSIAYTTVTWDAQLRAVRNWLVYLAREIHAVDLWTQLRAQERRALITVGSATDNAAFTPDEQRYITDLLNQRLEAILRTQRLTAEQTLYLTQAVEYLIEATTRLGKRDWWAVAAGVVFQVGLSAMFAPDARAAIFVALTQAVHAALKFAHLLSP
jgi:hypothetical protein